MPNVRVPLVHIQTPQFITIRLMVPSIPVASTVPFLGTPRLMSLGAAKGIEKFIRTHTREIQKIYGFNGDEYEPSYVVPGSISTSLTLDKIVFHSEDALSMLGVYRGNLLYQKNPFVVVEDQYALISPGSLPSKEFGKVLQFLGVTTSEPSVTLARSIFYNDCWFSEYPITYDITSDNMKITQSVQVQCGKVMSSEELGTTTISAIGKAVFENIKLK